jgi:small subunit ribosomal protein S16
MSVTIRLSKIGRKNQPAYKLVVSNTRDKRNGKYLDILGHYNPFEPKEKFSYDKKKFEEWKNKGALVTDAVNKLIEGTYEFKKYEPKQETAKEEKSEGKGGEAKETQEKPEGKEDKVNEEENKEPSEEKAEEKPKEEEK